MAEDEAARARAAAAEWHALEALGELCRLLELGALHREDLGLGVEVRHLIGTVWATWLRAFALQVWVDAEARGRQQALAPRPKWEEGAEALTPDLSADTVPELPDARRRSRRPTAPAPPPRRKPP